MARGQFHKPPDLKYTDLCIYIDEHMHLCKEAGKYPEVETRIFEYLYHIVYALSLKDNMFPNFADYEPFSLDTAGELFITMRDKYLREGEITRSGKVIEPVKSCLNYIKSVLFPLKVNYQRANYTVVLNPEVNISTDILSADLKEAIRSDYRWYLESDILTVIREISVPLNKILRNTPYRKDLLMMERLKISCILTFLGQLTLPEKLQNKFKDKPGSDEIDQKLMNCHLDNKDEVYLWHINEGLRDYVKLLVVILKDKIGKEIHEVRLANDLSDSVVDDIMASAYATYDCREGED